MIMKNPGSFLFFMNHPICVFNVFMNNPRYLYAFEIHIRFMAVFLF